MRRCLRTVCTSALALAAAGTVIFNTWGYSANPLCQSASVATVANPVRNPPVSRSEAIGALRKSILEGAWALWIEIPNTGRAENKQEAKNEAIQKGEELNQKEVSDLEQRLRMDPGSATEIVPKIENTIVALLKGGKMKSAYSIRVDDKLLSKMLDQFGRAASRDELSIIIGQYLEQDSALFFMSYFGLPKTTFLDGSVATLSKVDISTQNEMPGDTPTEQGQEEYPVFRFSGKVTFGSYTFIGEGDRTQRLSFTKVGPKSIALKFAQGATWTCYTEFAYVRGLGKVILPDGREVKLGYSK